MEKQADMTRQNAPSTKFENYEILAASISRLEEKIDENNSLSELLEFIMDEVFLFLNAEQGHIVLLNKNGSLDIPVSRLGIGRSYDPNQDLISSSVLSNVIMNHQGLITSDAMADPRFSGAASVMRLRLHSIICAPLLANEKMIGAIYLETRTKTGQFNLTDLKTLDAFGEYAAKAIEKAAIASL